MKIKKNLARIIGNTALAFALAIGYGCVSGQTRQEIDYEKKLHKLLNQIPTPRELQSVIVTKNKYHSLEEQFERVSGGDLAGFLLGDKLQALVIDGEKDGMYQVRFYNNREAKHSGPNTLLYGPDMNTVADTNYINKDQLDKLRARGILMSPESFAKSMGWKY